MGITVTLLPEIALSEAQSNALMDGGLDGAQVWVRFMTQHDSRVRPSHAALHGTVWRADDPLGPTPPLDYGCRCYLEVVAKPESLAARFFPAATVEPVPRAEAFATYLDEHLPEWPTVVEAASAAPPADRLSAAYLKVLEISPQHRADARDLARMAVEATSVAVQRAKTKDA